MSIVISDDIIHATKMSEADLRLEIAIFLYQQKNISSGKARYLAGMHLLEFRGELAKRGLCVNYDVDDFWADVATLKKLGDL